MASRGGPVLVVEDEAIIRLLLADELEAAGFDVLQAASADEAVLLLAKGGGGIRAVVTDVRMPGSMDGLGLAAWMRDHVAQVPLIVTSGFVSPVEARTTNPAIAAVFGKPYPPEDVVARVRQLVGRD